ncbi:MAG TPA: protein kinase [Polyangiaceae bacterium]|jgi:serine/threonine-protein kinase
MSAADAELEERARARLGTTIAGKYRLDAIIGVGGMAVVYRATHRNRAELALKLLHPELSVRESLRKRFLREGYAANSVKHPGVVSVVDDDVAEDGAAFLVMELLHGQNLETLVRANGRLPVPLVCGILDQLLDVLAAAHEAGIVHRDIKPANLFLTNQGDLKVLDFGIARVRDALTTASDATGTGIVLGTPAFMAPEQARGKSSEIDARTDLWAASATFFSLVSGKNVHKGDNAAQLVIAAATSFPPSVRSVAPVPEAIVRVVDRGMAFDRASRWVSAAEMRAELRAACVEELGTPPSRSLLAADSIAVASAPSMQTAEIVGSGERTMPADSTRSGGTMVSAKRPRSTLPLQLAVVGLLVVGAGVAIQVWRRPATPTPVVPVALTATNVASASVLVPSAPPPLASETAAPTETHSAKPVATHRRPAGTKLDCDPPFYIDSQDRKIFKKECL